MTDQRSSGGGLHMWMVTLWRAPVPSCLRLASYGRVVFQLSISSFRAFKCSFARAILVQQLANSFPANVHKPPQDLDLHLRQAAPHSRRIHTSAADIGSSPPKAARAAAAAGNESHNRARRISPQSVVLARAFARAGQGAERLWILDDLTLHRFEGGCASYPIQYALEEDHTSELQSRQYL